jgi:hypothetical protein
MEGSRETDKIPYVDEKRGTAASWRQPTTPSRTARWKALARA